MILTQPLGELASSIQTVDEEMTVHWAHRSVSVAVPDALAFRRPLACAVSDVSLITMDKAQRCGEPTKQKAGNRHWPVAGFGAGMSGGLSRYSRAAGS